MIWQDILMAIGGVGFSLALIPSVIGEHKPEKSTCAITGGILTSYVVAMATLGLFFSSIAIGITATMWWVLLYQQVRGRK